MINIICHFCQVIVGSLARFPKETYNFDTEHGDSVVVKLVFKQQHFIKKHNLLTSLQLLQINSFGGLSHLQMRRKVCQLKGIRIEAKE